MRDLRPEPLPIRPPCSLDLSIYVQILADLELDVIDAHRTMLSTRGPEAEKAATAFCEALALRDTLKGLLEARAGQVHSC